MKTNVAVFFGGRSVEHEISILSAIQAIGALDKNKYEITPVYISKQGVWYSGAELLNVDNYRDMKSLLTKVTKVYMLPLYGSNELYYDHSSLLGKQRKALAKIDVVLPVLHGTNGEDGVFQGVIEAIGLPYAGCDVLSSANGMDKITMKMILRGDGIPVLDFVWFTDKEWFADREAVLSKIETKIGYPVIVKPANLGSSVGISTAANREELIDSITTAEKFSGRMIVERLVEKLCEINCSALGGNGIIETSVCEQPIKSDKILSYEDKYLGGSKSAKSKGMASTQRLIPAPLDEATTHRIRQLTADTFHSLGCSGVARIDFIIDEATGEVFVNEINTIPGSLSFYLWEATGIKFNELMDRLVQIAVKRNQDRQQKTLTYDQNIFALKPAGTKLGGVKK